MFENERLMSRELFLLLPVLLVLHLFLGYVGQHRAAPVRIRESKERLLVTEGKIDSVAIVL